MKYLITAAQRDFLIEQMHNARNDQQWLNELKPIEPLCNTVLWDMSADRFDESSYVEIITYARAIEAHILGEKHDTVHTTI